MNRPRPSLLRTALHNIIVILPWVFQGLLFMLGWIVTSASAIWSSIPEKVGLMTNEWLDRAFFAGVPTEMTPVLTSILRVVAWISVVLGWIFLSFITVAVVNIIWSLVF